jgi:hypothetical protein
MNQTERPLRLSLLTWGLTLGVFTNVCMGAEAQIAELREAETAFKAGDTNKAWRLYDGRKNAVLASMARLDVDFVVWLAREHANHRELPEAELLIFSCANLWNERNVTNMALNVACAEILVEQQQYPVARCMCEKVLAGNPPPAPEAAFVAQLLLLHMDIACSKDVNTARITEILTSLFAREDRFKVRVSGLVSCGRKSVFQDAFYGVPKSQLPPDQCFTNEPHKITISRKFKDVSDQKLIAAAELAHAKK